MGVRETPESPVPLCILLELVACAALSFSAAPFSAFPAAVETLFCDYERLTGACVKRFEVSVPCGEEEFEQFCAVLALCGRNAIELLRTHQVESTAHACVDSSEYSEAESDDSSSALSGDELVCSIQHSAGGPHDTVCKDSCVGSDHD